MRLGVHLHAYESLVVQKELAVGRGCWLGRGWERSCLSLHNVVLQNSQESEKSKLEPDLLGHYERVFIKVGDYNIF